MNVKKRAQNEDNQAIDEIGIDIADDAVPATTVFGGKSGGACSASRWGK